MKREEAVRILKNQSPGSARDASSGDLFTAMLQLRRLQAIVDQIGYKCDT